eukprot:2270068-Rhodomonas_salina.2
MLERTHRSLTVAWTVPPPSLRPFSILFSTGNPYAESRADRGCAAARGSRPCARATLPTFSRCSRPRPAATTSAKSEFRCVCV